jgi:hypothetical protein
MARKPSQLPPHVTAVPSPPSGPVVRPSSYADRAAAMDAITHANPHTLVNFLDALPEDEEGNRNRAELARVFARNRHFQFAWRDRQFGGSQQAYATFLATYAAGASRSFDPVTGTIRRHDGSATQLHGWDYKAL